MKKGHIVKFYRVRRFFVLKGVLKWVLKISKVPNVPINAYEPKFVRGPNLASWFLSFRYSWKETLKVKEKVLWGKSTKAMIILMFQMYASYICSCFVLLLFNLWLYQVLSFIFSLDHCIFVRTVGVQIQRVFWILWCDCQRWCVFLKGSRSPFWCVSCNQSVWLLSGILRGFSGTGCSSWLRVSQYKFLVWIFLSLISLNLFLLEVYNYCYKQPIVSQKQLVDFLLLSENSF